MKNTEKDIFYKYLPLHLALLIPIPGRFVFGITIVIEHLLLTLVGTLINSLVNKLKLKELKTVIILLTMISATIFFRQILVVTYTEIALSLGLLIFLPPVSLFIIQIIFSDLEKPLIRRLKTNSIQTAIFSLNTLIFFLFRDIAGYGTFTFFGKNHRIFEKVILNPDKVGIFTFFASISGALVLTGLVIYLFMFIRNKARIISGRGE